MKDLASSVGALASLIMGVLMLVLAVAALWKGDPLHVFAGYLGGSAACGEACDHFLGIRKVSVRRR